MPGPGKEEGGRLGSRALEIPCPTCPTWSHFIQDKLKISIYYSPWTSTNVLS